MSANTLLEDTNNLDLVLEIPKNFKTHQRYAYKIRKQNLKTKRLEMRLDKIDSEDKAGLLIVAGMAAAMIFIWLMSHTGNILASIRPQPPISAAQLYEQCVNRSRSEDSSEEQIRLLEACKPLITSQN